jgi:metal-responsive CopG/Arc/MetJ family transcriptional regulator
MCYSASKCLQRYLLIYIDISMAMKRVLLSLPEEMVKVLENERKERYFETIPETIRVILSDYLRNKVKRK